MAKRIFSAILISLFVLPLTSCQSYERPYPDYFTGEYVQEHYELIDMNLVYLQSYHRRTSRISLNGQEYQFMKIKEVPLAQFVGMVSYTSLFPSYRHYILFNLESPVNPICDFEIEKIELYARKSGLAMGGEGFDKYGELIYSKQLYEVNTLEVMQEISESIRNADKENEYPPKLKYGNQTITLRIHFKEYENIVWDAEVGEKEGKYYLYILLVDEERGIFSLDGNYVYAYVGPQFDAMMESLLADL